MKRINAALAALFVLFIILAGCTQGDAVKVNNTAENASSVTTKKTAQDAFNTYQETKLAAFERIVTAYDPNMDIYFEKMMSALVDSAYLAPLTALDNKPDGIKFVESNGVTDYKLVKTDSGYDITYIDQQGAAVKQVCIYDPSKDYMKTVITDTEGTEIYCFEYIWAGSGYAVQFTANGFIVRGFIEKPGDAAYGLTLDEGLREPLSGEAALNIDFAKNDDFYFMLESDKLTLVENGETLTF